MILYLLIQKAVSRPRENKEIHPITLRKYFIIKQSSLNEGNRKHYSVIGADQPITRGGGNQLCSIF